MTTWTNVLAVAIGGAAGSVARYLIALGANALPGGTTMLGTTAANLLGCAAIGAFAQYAEMEGVISERLRLAVQVGLLGGLTTFSTFAAESSSLASSGRWMWTGIYVSANLLLGWLLLSLSASVVRDWMT